MAISAAPPDAAVEARLRCEQVFLDFHGHIDGGHATRSLELVTDDAVLEVRGTRHQGRQAIDAFLRAREADSTRRTRHLASNFRFAFESERSARATANLALFTAGDDDELALEAVVDCELEFRRAADGAWRMSRRRHTRFATAP